MRLALAITLGFAVALLVWLGFREAPAERTSAAAPAAVAARSPERNAAPDRPRTQPRTRTRPATVPRTAPRVFRRALRDRIVELEDVWAACVEAAPVPDGAVGMMFVVAATEDGDAIAVESTEVDHDLTTIEDPALLDCLRASTRDLTFDALPEGVDAVSIHDTVRVENGVYAGRGGMDLVYLR